MCPIETPEGPNIGLIGGLASFARVNPFGFIESPYRVVKNGKVTDEIVYLTADEEEDYVVAQANAPIDAKGNFLTDRVLVRRSPQAAIAAGPPPPARAGRVLRRHHRDLLGAARRSPDDGRLAEADRLGRHRADPLPRARRRQPCAHGRQHAASGRAAGAGRGALHRHRHRERAARPTPPTWCSPRTTARSSNSTATTSSWTTRSWVEDDPAAQVRAVQPGHLHHPEAPCRRGRQGQEGRAPRRRSLDRQRRAGARQEPARRLHAVGGLQLRGRHHPLASAW